MANFDQILAQILFEIDDSIGASVEEIRSALRSAIQVGLSAKVLEVTVYKLAQVGATRTVCAGPPPSEPSNEDKVVEKYLHSGMEIEISRAAGYHSPPRYFAVVFNPHAKQRSGGLIDADSYAELKEAAEARAERRAELFQKRLSKQQAR